MAAGDKERLREGSLNGMNFELWNFQSNSTTAVALRTKLRSIDHVSITAAEDVSTVNSNPQYTATGGTVNIKFTGPMVDKKYTVMVWGLI